MNHKKQKMRWRLNHYMVLVAVLLIFLVVNSLSIKRYYRTHFGANNDAEVSEVTQKLLKNLPGPVDVTFYIAYEADPVARLIQPNLERLKEEYRYHAKGKIKFHMVDPYLEQQKAVQLVEEFKLASNEDVILVQYGGKTRVIKVKDMVEVEMGGAFDGNVPRILSFKAEQMLSSTIYGLTSGAQKVVYFTTGHGEFDPLPVAPDPRGYSMLTSYIQQQNVAVRKVDFSRVSEVPQDADLVFIAGPKISFEPFEIDIINAYLNRGGDKPGRLVLLIDPHTASSLDYLLKDYGVVFRGDIIMREFSLLGQPRAIMDGMVSEFADHPALSWMKGHAGNLSLGPSRSLEVHQDATRENLTVTELCKTTDVYWGETQPQAETIAFHEGVDHPGPLTIGVMIDAGSVSGGDVQLNEMKVLAIGSAGFLVNQNLSRNAYNVDFILNSINWMLGKDNLLGIAAKTPDEFTIEMTHGQYSMLFVSLIAVILAAAGTGILIWLQRRQ